MLLTITNGTASGQSAQIDVEPDATSIDVLTALTETKTFNVNATNQRYVISSPRLGRDLSPNETLGDAGIQSGDLLTIQTSETGYRSNRSFGAAITSGRPAWV
jgi:hypothetical protein